MNRSLVQDAFNAFKAAFPERAAELDAEWQALSGAGSPPTKAELDQEYEDSKPSLRMSSRAGKAVLDAFGRAEPGSDVERLVERIEKAVRAICDESGPGEPKYLLVNEDGTPIIEAETLDDAVEEIIGAWIRQQIDREVAAEKERPRI